MISSNDFRTGTTIELDGAVWRVIEFLHVKPGKGSAFVRAARSMFERNQVDPSDVAIGLTGQFRAVDVTKRRYDAKGF